MHLALPTLLDLDAGSPPRLARILLDVLVRVRVRVRGEGQGRVRVSVRVRVRVRVKVSG